MSVVIKENEIIFNWFQDDYEISFEKLIESFEGEIDQDIRLFDIRLQMALSTNITFNPGFRYTNTDTSKDVSRLTLKLSNVWFSYESLLKAYDNSSLLTNRSKTTSLSEDILDELLGEYHFDIITKSFRQYHSDNIHCNSKFREDSQRYIDYLTSGATSNSQKRALHRIFNIFTNNEDMAINDVLSLVYAVRNQYVHSGESPKSGVKYFSTKIEVLKNAHDFLVLICLRLATLLIDKRLASVE
ncbi:hypothetical protein J4G63_03545 [Aeromonas sobria]|uniref:Apea-like HEPN domain-containing protein n=1 Tax=Aeromonas sobria TaxID=646 RepID=A0A1S2CP31_AERSO|nr:hypothetical protein [Aeromonas sobria]MBS4686333.1 hypothetical protein [Aeromonas sobria]OHY89899.1 hypothetical protein BJD16_06105 [Aeromonas sobria]